MSSRTSSRLRRLYKMRDDSNKVLNLDTLNHCQKMDYPIGDDMSEYWYMNKKLDKILNDSVCNNPFGIIEIM